MANVYGDVTALRSAGLLNLPDGSQDSRLLEMLKHLNLRTGTHHHHRRLQFQSLDLLL